jgi:hypothetical protein
VAAIFSFSFSPSTESPFPTSSLSFWLPIHLSLLFSWELSQLTQLLLFLRHLCLNLPLFLHNRQLQVFRLLDVSPFDDILFQHLLPYHKQLHSLQLLLLVRLHNFLNLLNLAQLFWLHSQHLQHFSFINSMYFARSMRLNFSLQVGC